MATDTDRVKLWNSLFHQAWLETSRVHDLSTGTVTPHNFDPLGGRLSDEEQAVLSSLLFCTLAIEARANHLIAELVDKGRISPDEGYAVEHLPPLRKWCLLPKLDRRRRSIDLGRHPHQAVAEICEKRNALVHVSYDRLASIPTPKKMLSLYRGFVEAMEDMNVLLGRTAKPRRYVSAISTF